MSVIGPRPQLVRDMTFMTKEQRMRHTAKPGLSGLAQVNGRNAITWEDKLEWDQKYIKKICQKYVDMVVNVIKENILAYDGSFRIMKGFLIRNKKRKEYNHLYDQLMADPPDISYTR